LAGLCEIIHPEAHSTTLTALNRFFIFLLFFAPSQQNATAVASSHGKTKQKNISGCCATAVQVEQSFKRFLQRGEPLWRKSEKMDTRSSIARYWGHRCVTG